MLGDVQKGLRLYSLKYWSVLLLMGCGVAAAPAAEKTFAERFAGVKRWELRYSYSTNSPHTWEEDGYTYNRSAWTESETGLIVLTAESSDAERMRIDGEGKATASFNYARQKTGIGDYLETRWDRGNGAPLTKATVEFDFIEGTYHVSLYPGDWEAQYGGTEKWSLNFNKYGPSNQTYHVNIPTPAPAEKILKLPTSGRLITGSFSWEERWNAEAKENPGFDRAKRARVDPIRGTTRWVLVPADPLDAELIVEPQQYNEWLPEGGKSEAESGNSIAIKATLVPKGATSGEPPSKARRMTFQLLDSSAEKGVALNHPLTTATDALDLGFEAKLNPDGWQVGESGSSIQSSDGNYDSLTAKLSSFDWGAHGTVLVTAELTDGRMVVGHLKESDRREVLIPKRDPKSNIGDQWKSLVKFSGADDEDEDKQAGNDKPGDGLSAYEEYRGLIANGVHTRKKGLLDPTKKDLVIRNEIGKEARPGFDLFTSASGIQIVEVTKDELSETRLVTSNRGSAHRGSQYGLRLISDKLTSKTAGENRPADVLGKTPLKSEAVAIDLAFARSSYAAQAAAIAGKVQMPYTVEEDIANTVAHEIAHGVGAPHHGKDADFKGHTEITKRMVDWPIYDEDGKQVNVEENQPYKLKGNIGRPGSDASGDANCIMCYTTYYNWAAIGPAGGPFKYYAVGVQPVGKTFCTNPKGTGMNAPRQLADGTEIPGFFGDAQGQARDAAVGNCLGTMKVRDW